MILISSHIFVFIILLFVIITFGNSLFLSKYGTAVVTSLCMLCTSQQKGFFPYFEMHAQDLKLFFVL